MSILAKNNWIRSKSRMQKIGRILGYAFLTLTAMLAIAITKTIGWRPIIGPRHRASVARKFESTPQRLMRGEYLVQHVALCILCPL